MARIYDTANLNEEALASFTPDEASNIYNGLDCLLTSDIYNTLKTQLDSEPTNVRETYEFSLRKLAPVLSMAWRGTLINESSRKQAISELTKELRFHDSRFQRILKVVCDQDDNPKYYFNWNSPVQLKQLFYNRLGIRPIRQRNSKGIFAPTTNEAAMEAIAENYVFARPLANYVLLLRNLSKQLSFLKTEIDADSRIRCNYQIAGTNTGRLSSSMNDFGTGTNLQNVNRALRFPFCADKGKILINIDLEQADARNVGAICWNLFVDEHGPDWAGAYLDACESGDLHTAVCRMAYPELDWPEDPALHKKFCDGLIAFGQDSYRQISKKLGHGTNYIGQPKTMAKHLKTPVGIIEAFQKAYFNAFPCLPAWHQKRFQDLIETRTITTLFGRRRQFWGSPTESRTRRQAIAFEPQSCTGEQIDRGMYQIWSHFNPKHVQLLNQVHDSILLQIPYEALDELLPQILEIMKVTLTLKQGREFTVPLDAAVGWNWAYASEENPYGVQGWKGKETRVPPRPVVKKRKSLSQILHKKTA